MAQKMECAGGVPGFLAAGAGGTRSPVVAFVGRPGKSVALTEYERRQDMARRLNAAADRCTEDPRMREVWRSKAIKATYLPAAELTARPRVLADFTPGGFDPRDRPVSLLWVVGLLTLIALAVGLTPVSP